MADNKNNNERNVPHLRFPEFSGEWKKCKFGDIATGFDYGMNAAAKPFDGENKYIRITDIDEASSTYNDKDIVSPDGRLTDNYVVNDRDILLARTGASTGKSYLYRKSDGKLYYAGFLIRANITEHNPYFVFSQLHTHRYWRWVSIMSARSGQPGINSQEYSSFPIFTTSLHEENKISTLLSLLNERIVTQNKIIEDLKKLKSAIVDYTFTNDTKSWRKQILLSDISTKIIRKNTDNRISNVLSNSANQGVVPQSEVFDREIANEDNTSNYFVISQNDFVYNPRKSVTAPYGPINKYNGELDGVISPLYLCFRTHDIDVDYLVWYFKSRSWYEYVYKNGDSGVRHDRVSIKDEVFFSMPLNIHSTLEQKEIAQRLNGIERFVRQEEQYLSLIQSQKDYLLQQMFI